MSDIDYADPCAVAKALREELARRALQGNVVQLSAGDKSVRYQELPLDELTKQLTYWEQQCANKTGRTTRRAITSGAGPCPPRGRQPA